MPITKFLQSLNGTCRHCGQKTGFLQRDHPQCRQTHQAGMNEMTQLAAQAASSHTFNEAALRQTLGTAHRKARHDPRGGRGLWKQQSSNENSTPAASNNNGELRPTLTCRKDFMSRRS